MSLQKILIIALVLCCLLGEVLTAKGKAAAKKAEPKKKDAKDSKKKK